MCVIAIKPQGVGMIQDKILQQMWDYNKDGAGYMYPDNGKVVVSKGYMNFEDFKRSLDALPNKDDLPLVLHFRITTHGGTSPENTHPFPVSSKEEHLKALDVRANLAMAHNGIISSVPKHDTNSDTQMFIKDVISPLSKLGDSDFLTTYSTLINYGIGASKLAFMDGNGDITKFGTWQEKEGVHYSNLNHEPRAAVSYYYNGTYNNKQTTKTSYLSSLKKEDMVNGDYFQVSEFLSVTMQSTYQVFPGDIVRYFEDSLTGKRSMVNMYTGDYIEHVIYHGYLEKISKKEVARLSPYFYSDYSSDKRTVFDYEPKNELIVKAEPTKFDTGIVTSAWLSNKGKPKKMTRKLKRIKVGTEITYVTKQDNLETSTINTDSWYYDLDKDLIYILLGGILTPLTDAVFTEHLNKSGDIFIKSEDKMFRGTKTFRGALFYERVI